MTLFQGASFRATQNVAMSDGARKENSDGKSANGGEWQRASFLRVMRHVTGRCHARPSIDDQIKNAPRSGETTWPFPEGIMKTGVLRAAAFAAACLSIWLLTLNEA